MSNFNVSEFDHLWTSCHTHLTEKLLLGQGKKTEVAPKDLLFIVICVLKAWKLYCIGTEWVRSLIEKVQHSKRCLLFSCAVETLSPNWFDELVNNAYSKLTTTSLVKKRAQFKNFTYALYATDMIFQQGNHPSGTMLKGKHYFSFKHKLYIYKTEVSVAPTGLQLTLQNINQAASLTWLFFRVISGSRRPHQIWWRCGYHRPFSIN